MPQIATIYNGNYVVWQRKLAEIIVDLKADVTAIRKLGLIIAESTLFHSSVSTGIYVSLEVASNGAPNTWSMIYEAPLNSGSWLSDVNNIAAPASGAWVENSYLFVNNVNITGRYLRFRIAADASYTPLQTVALKKVVVQDGSDNSLLAGASAQINVLGWQTGKVLKDILEDILEDHVLIKTLGEETIAARVSPKGTWDNTAEQYAAPLPKIFASLKARLDDLEQDAERRLTARKVVVPVEDMVSIPATQTTFDTHIIADMPHRKLKQYADTNDLVDVLVQETDGLGAYEYPLRDNSGALIVGRVTYGCDTAGYLANSVAKVSLIRADTGAPFSMTSTKSAKLVLPVETDLFHMDKADLTRSQFSTAVIQDIGIINNIESIKSELQAAVVSDSVTQDLVVYENGGVFYADLVFNSNAVIASGWQVLKNSLPAIPSGDFTFISNNKVRLDTHDNSAPTKWQISYFTQTQPNLDGKINEIIAAIAKLATTINNVVTNLDEINDALMPHSHTEILQIDACANDGFDYFKPLTYKARDIDNGAAIIFKNGTSIGAKDTTWAFKGDGIVALHRASEAYNTSDEYAIRYFFRQYEHLVNKLQDMTNTTDRDLIARNWRITNPVPPEADSNGVKLI